MRNLDFNNSPPRFRGKIITDEFTGSITSVEEICDVHLIQNGDAHLLDEIFGFNLMWMAEPTVGEISLSIKGHSVRSYQRI